MLQFMMPNIAEHKKVYKLLLFGFFVHALILKAAMDSYFSSPIDQGMEPIRSTNNPPAKRVIFLVGDGLRAEAIYGDNSDVAPNLHRIRQTRGSWGVAHTRVPTESRPGHVALLAGIYEDPAAILKGWKSNPVDFDSVINQSTNAYCWGGPSIINMFNKDDLSHIHRRSYDSSWEDFGKNSTITLDQWVFDELRDYIHSLQDCTACMEQFNQTGNLIFLHLLGTDTAGHAFKPKSDEYKNNIKFVDSYIPQIEELIEDTFNDQATGYVFTADHGMTDWGSHGAGSKHETETPLIAWGAGIRVEDLQKDVNQIDIAPLVSALIGINYPINNLGRLPVDYIDTNMSTLHEMMMSNVYQLMETFKVKKRRLQDSAFKFVPFDGFDNEHLEASVKALRNLSAVGNHELFKLKVDSFVKFLIDGTDYYHNYYQFPILISVAIGFVLWIVYLGVCNMELRRHDYLPIRYYDYGNVHTYVFATLYITIVIMTYAQNLPLMCYCYFSFPVIMTHVLSFNIRYVVECGKRIQDFGLKQFYIYVFLYACGLKLVVNAFDTRHSLSMAMCMAAIVVLYSRHLGSRNTRFQMMCWIICCGVLAIFPNMPVMKTTFNFHLYSAGVLLWWLVFKNAIFPHMMDDIRNKNIQWQFLILKLTPIYTLAVEMKIVGAESPIKYLAWIWAAVPIVMIPLSSTRIYSRLTSIFLGFATFYLMVTTNFEVLFMLNYMITLYVWLKIEAGCTGYDSIVRSYFLTDTRDERKQNSHDFRRAFIFIVLIFMGFFGTGNIASLNSFDPLWVQCFVTVFSPFQMSALILLRIAVPFFYTSCVYRAVNMFCRSNTFNMFCIVLMFSDVMLLQLLFQITNVGSWLEIGLSLSKFLIMEGFVLILLLLYGFAYILTTMKM